MNLPKHPHPRNLSLLWCQSFYNVSLVTKLLILRVISDPAPASKFRHIQAAVMHRDTHITNLHGLNLTTPGECDGFCVNRQRVAVPLAISGGQIAVFEVRQQLQFKLRKLLI